MEGERETGLAVIVEIQSSVTTGEMGGKNGKGKNLTKEEPRGIIRVQARDSWEEGGVDRENIFPDISELFPREGGPRSTPIEYFLKNSLSEKLLLREGEE